jgi:hypothetical protein
MKYLKRPTKSQHKRTLELIDLYEIHVKAVKERADSSNWQQYSVNFLTWNNGL